MSNRLPYPTCASSDSGIILTNSTGGSGSSLPADTSGSLVGSVQTLVSSGTSTSVPFTAQAVGDLLVVIMRVNAPGNITSLAISDSVNGAWSQAATAGIGSTNAFAIYYVKNTFVGNIGGILITPAPSQTCNFQVCAAEYSGPLGSPLLDQAAASATGTGSTSTSNSITTTQARELLVSMVGNVTANGLTITAGAGFTFRAAAQGNAGLEDEVVTSTGTYTASFGLGSSVTWTQLLASFRLG